MDLVLCLVIFVAVTNSVAVNATDNVRARFWWKSCGSQSDAIKVKELDVFQNRSSYLYVTGKGKVALNLTSPIQGNLEMKKKVLGLWIPIPCVEGFGSCSYDNICSLSPYSSDCPKIYTDNNIPCHCPVTQGLYSFTGLPLDMHFLPHWLENGAYSIRATLSWGGRQILCLKMVIDIEINGNPT